MKLVELLARELDEWPKGYDRIVQSAKDLTLPVDDDRIQFDHGQWDYCTPSMRIYDEQFGLSELATDRATAIVTREMWESERERLEDEQDATTVRERQGQPTVPVSIEPDWSKAPEGATHWYQDGIVPWRMLEEGTWHAWMDNGWHVVAASSAKNYISRPTQPQWRGPEDGLPPVGVTCWWKRDGYQCKVYIYSDHAGWAHGWNAELECGYGSKDPADFSPVGQRTPRDKWIEAATTAYFNGACTHKGGIAAIYDTMISKLPGDGE